MTPGPAGPRWDVLGVGSAAVDDRLYVAHFPNPDEKMPIQSAVRQAGGQAATALVAAARLGSKVALAACLGEDELSRFMRSELEAGGVDCSLLPPFPGSRPYHAVVIVDTSCGSRSILYSSEGVREPDPQSILPEWVAASRVVLIDNNTPLSGLRAAQLARSMQVPVVADIERVNIPGLESLLDTVDHLVVNLQFGRAYTGLQDPARMVQALMRPHQSACVVTAGGEGCWFSDHGGKPEHFPAYRVTVADTTGCGDIFHGAYAAMLARGEGVRAAIQAASAAAALKAIRSDGWKGIPDQHAVDAFLA